MSQARNAAPDFFEDDDFEFDFDEFEAPTPDDFRPGAEPDGVGEPPASSLSRSSVTPEPALGRLAFEPPGDVEDTPEPAAKPDLAHPATDDFNRFDDPRFDAVESAGAVPEEPPLVFEDLEAAPVAAAPRPPVMEVGVDAAPESFGHAAGFNPVGELLAGAEAALGEVSVPRIAIHVFAESERTLDAADRAAADRRLSRATATVRRGGIDAALDVYRGEPTPPLVILEGLNGGRALLSDLDRLAEICDPSTKVVVIGRDNDIALYRELIRRGVSEYLVAPVDPLGLIRTIASLYNDPAQPFVGRTMAFVGARGGAGASTVAHNTAWAIAERLKAETVVVDLDLPFGTAGLDFNQDGQTSVAEALNAPERLDPVLMDRMMVRCGERLSLLTAPATLDADYDISPEVFDEVVQKVRGAAPMVVLDLPHAWNAWVRRMLVTADEVVIVATPDLASLRNAKNMVDLARAARPNDSPPRVVLNQVGVKDRPEIPVKEFGAAVGVQPCLVLPFDPKVFGQAANNGQMVGDVAKKSKSADGFAHLARVVSLREPPAPERSKSLFAGLFNR